MHISTLDAYRKKEWAYAAALTNWMPITSGGSAS
jgi:hypothetical protein